MQAWMCGGTKGFSWIALPLRSRQDNSILLHLGFLRGPSSRKLLGDLYYHMYLRSHFSGFNRDKNWIMQGMQ